MTSNKVKKDIMESTPIQNRHDSGYEGHGAFGYNIEISPIRKNVSYRYITNILNRRYDAKSKSSISCELENVCRKLPFVNTDYANKKTVSSSGSDDSGIATMCKTPNNKIGFNNVSASEKPRLNLKSFPTDLSCDISRNYFNNNYSKFYQPYKYICKEGLNDQISTINIRSDKQLLDKNNNEVKNVSHIKRKPFPTMDFLSELNLRNCTSIISEILSYLPDEDLRKASYVCRNWKNIIFDDSKANKRRLDYINNRKNITRGPNKENRMETKCQSERSHKSVFLSIVNVSNGVSKQPLYNDNLGRFDSFCQEVQTLQEKEELMKCPKCDYPSKVESGTKYCCTRNLCLHEFCKECFGPYMDNHICSELKLETSLPSIIIGSKKSRKNLRRL